MLVDVHLPQNNENILS